MRTLMGEIWKMLEREKRELREKNRKRGLLDGVDTAGAILENLIGAIFIGSFLMLVASVIGFAETMNLRYAIAIVPFAVIIFGLLLMNET